MYRRAVDRVKIRSEIFPGSLQFLWAGERKALILKSLILAILCNSGIDFLSLWKTQLGFEELFEEFPKSSHLLDELLMFFGVSVL